ncbi:hypothetical protein [Halorarius litoreus]|uniref:hypothetical protein n=1 Tax=Halorarius litoreus TaxID=2962676 RepID=UPI0020CF890A|nr:hypothetical protein [Halorarius litoreus]
MTRVLDFEAARGDGDSWQRADPRNAVIQRLRYDQFGIALDDAEDAHVVTLRHEGRGYVGECDCKGYTFHRGPCAHLATLRKAEFIGANMADGQPVVIPDEIDKFDHDIEQALADGGERL